MFKYIVFSTAIAIASIAAFFSVSGIGKLFAGSFIPVVIMASGLEVGKLITASFLTRSWRKLPNILRIYYSIATVILILITSMGIYGFLTSAYQTVSDELTVVEQQINTLELKRDRYAGQIEILTNDREAINSRISELTSGLSNNVIQYRDTVTNEIITSTSSNTRRVLQAELDDARSQRDRILTRTEEYNDSITTIDLQILDLRTNSEVVAEVGPLRYLSNLTGWSMDKIVNIFALLLIFVFDPLAISLVIGYNYIQVYGRSRDPDVDYKIYNDNKEEIPEEIINTEEPEEKLPEEKIEELPLDKPQEKVLNLQDIGEYANYSSTRKG